MTRKKIPRASHPVAAALERALEQGCTRMVLCAIDNDNGDMTIVSAPGMDRLNILGLLAHSQVIVSVTDLHNGGDE